jgi:hypothetical protein
VKFDVEVGAFKEMRVVEGAHDFTLFLLLYFQWSGKDYLGKNVCHSCKRLKTK